MKDGRDEATLGRHAVEQIDALANFIMAEIEGEPSQSQGAVDTAIRIMRTQRDDLLRFRHSTRAPAPDEAATRLDHRALVHAAWLRGRGGHSWVETSVALIPEPEATATATLEDAIAICDRIQNEGKQMSEHLKEYRQGWQDAAGECGACIRALIPGAETSSGEGP